MLTLVAPSSMTVDQQTLWLASAVDALADIRTDEVRQISAEVRRSVTRHTQIVPAIAERVAELRSRKYAVERIGPPLPQPPERKPAPPLTQAEVNRMPKWIAEIGLRVGFLRREGGKIVPVAESELAAL
jgi:hypothetical protein